MIKDVIKDTEEEIGIEVNHLHLKLAKEQGDGCLKSHKYNYSNIKKDFFLVLL